MRVEALDHLVLTVADVAATVRFYEDVLGMQPVRFDAADCTSRWALMFGVQKINLHQAGAEFAPHADNPKSGSADLCFLSDQAVSTWVQWFEKHHVEIVDDPVERTGAQTKLLSVYVRDPDGNLIEVSNAI